MLGCPIPECFLEDLVEQYPADAHNEYGIHYVGEERENRRLVEFEAQIKPYAYDRRAQD